MAKVVRDVKLATGKLAPGWPHEIAVTQVSTNKIITAMATYPGADAAIAAWPLVNE